MERLAISLSVSLRPSGYAGNAPIAGLGAMHNKLLKRSIISKSRNSGMEARVGIAATKIGFADLIVDWSLF